MDNLRRWREDPRVFVREVFGATPDPWQDEALEAFPHSPRLAFKASRGPGKTAVLAWLAWNFLLTRLHPNIAATSISADNLRDGLSKEMSKWAGISTPQYKGMLPGLFEMQRERIYAKTVERGSDTWFMSFRTWAKAASSEQLGTTMAGLHSDYVMCLLDESGSMPVPILQAAEGVLSSCVEGHIVQAGNTNSLDGALYYACVKNRDLWKVVIISGDPDDPNRSTRVDINWARDLIKSEGRESQFIKVTLLGEWPTASLNALLGPDDIEAAFARKYQQADIDHAARILGVDVAREGDDASVIFPRQGLVAFKPNVMRNVTGIVGATQVATVWRDWDVDAVFVDNTGGFGSSWVDQLTTMNRTPIPINFSSSPIDKRYANKRSEMYFLMAEWIKNGGSLPNEPELMAELVEPTYSFKGDALQLEPKDLIKKRIGRSLDRADGLCLTFAAPITRKVNAILPQRAKHDERWDPYAEMMRT